MFGHAQHFDVWDIIGMTIMVIDVMALFVLAVYLFQRDFLR